MGIRVFVFTIFRQSVKAALSCRKTRRSGSAGILFGEDDSGSCWFVTEKGTMEEPQLFASDGFLPCSGIRGAEYLTLISYRGQNVSLCSPVQAILTIAPVEDTEYRDRHAEVKGWGKFYLRIPVEMQVIGYVKGTPYPCDQLVLMTCEDKKVYGYDGDELHLVASDLNQMFGEGIAYPALKSYYHGEAFKDMTKEDWEKVKQGPVGKKLDEEHHKLVASHKSALLENIRKSRQKQRCHQQCVSFLPDSKLTQLQRGGT
ncbi:uncharacterized protein LOC124879368 [Girardinichthys multiradiatus]|uniref:uncharacterized protein LOC124879368 n=1 Tax=Girardinichthys multiradiatus TaxID=208333 RepID=UPI001FAE02E4|nr:uncharacterized protein LOC124879368 [Girardinichthys multiradiatus]